jgi:hypothetical protein
MCEGLNAWRVSSYIWGRYGLWSVVILLATASGFFYLIYHVLGLAFLVYKIHGKVLMSFDRLIML